LSSVIYKKRNQNDCQKGDERMQLKDSHQVHVRKKSCVREFNSPISAGIGPDKLLKAVICEKSKAK
jgi:hypothetical protein